MLLRQENQTHLAPQGPGGERAFMSARSSKSSQLQVPATSVTCSPSRTSVTGFLLSTLSAQDASQIAKELGRRRNGVLSGSALRAGGPLAAGRGRQASGEAAASVPAPASPLPRAPACAPRSRTAPVFDSIDDRTNLPLDTVEFLVSAFVIALARRGRQRRANPARSERMCFGTPHKMNRSVSHLRSFNGYDGPEIRRSLAGRSARRSGAPPCLIKRQFRSLVEPRPNSKVRPQGGHFVALGDNRPLVT